MTAVTADVGHLANTVALIQHPTRDIDANFGPAAKMMYSFIALGQPRPVFRAAAARPG
jgi:hypothetical protein